MDIKYDRIIVPGDTIFTPSIILSCALLKLINPIIKITRSDDPLEEYKNSKNSIMIGFKGYEYEESKTMRINGCFYGTAGNLWLAYYNYFYHRSHVFYYLNSLDFYRAIDNTIFCPIDVLEVGQPIFWEYSITSFVQKFVDIIRTYNRKWIEDEMTNQEAFEEIVMLVSQYLDTLINSTLYKEYNI